MSSRSTDHCVIESNGPRCAPSGCQALPSTVSLHHRSGPHLHCGAGRGRPPNVRNALCRSIPGTPLQLLAPSPEPGLWAAASRAEFGAIGARATAMAVCPDTPPRRAHAATPRPRRQPQVCCAPATLACKQDVTANPVAMADCPAHDVCSFRTRFFTSPNLPRHQSSRTKYLTAVRLSEAHRRRPCSTFPEAEQAALEGRSGACPATPPRWRPRPWRACPRASFALGRSDPAVWQRTHASGQVGCLLSDCAGPHTTDIYIPDPQSIVESSVPETCTHDNVVVNCRLQRESITMEAWNRMQTYSRASAPKATSPPTAGAARALALGCSCAAVLHCAKQGQAATRHCARPARPPLRLCPLVPQVLHARFFARARPPPPPPRIATSVHVNTCRVFTCMITQSDHKSLILAMIYCRKTVNFVETAVDRGGSR